MAGFDLHPHRRRTKLLQLLEHELLDFVGFLVWNEPKRQLGSSPGWNNRLAPLPLVSARHTIDLNRRPRAALFDWGKSFFAKELRHSHELAKLAFLEGQSSKLFAFVC